MVACRLNLRGLNITVISIGTEHLSLVKLFLIYLEWIKNDNQKLWRLSSIIRFDMLGVLRASKAGLFCIFVAFQALLIPAWKGYK